MQDEINHQNKQKVMESHIFGSTNERNSPQKATQINKPEQKIKRTTSRVAALPPLSDAIPPLASQNHTNQNNTIPDFHFEVQDIQPYQRIQPQHHPASRPIDENRYELCTPHGSRFASNTTVARPQTPSFDGLIKESNVPPLSPFPDFNFEAPQIQTNFEFRVRPLTTQTNRNMKKLHISTNSEMRRMRDEIQEDSQQFSARISTMKTDE